MRYDPDRHHRRSHRLQGYDYSRNGAYFVTICVHNRECLLGEICNETLAFSEIGQAVERIWTEIPERFPSILLDEYVLVPNHLHGILQFTEPGNKHRITAREYGDSASRIQGAASSAPTGIVVSPKKVIG